MTACSGGEASAFLALPWRIAINTVLGTAPRGLTGLLLNIGGAAANFTVFGGLISCLYGGALGLLVPLTHRESVTCVAETASSLSSTNIPLVRGSVGCPTFIHMTGEFRLFPAQTITAS